MKKIKIKAPTKKELAEKLSKLYNKQLRRVEQYYFVLSNFEKFYYHADTDGYHINIEDTNYYFRKAIQLNII